MLAADRLSIGQPHNNWLEVWNSCTIKCHHILTNSLKIYFYTITVKCAIVVVFCHLFPYKLCFYRFAPAVVAQYVTTICSLTGCLQQRKKTCNKSEKYGERSSNPALPIWSTNLIWDACYQVFSLWPHWVGSSIV
jgi:hypothetical protein